MFVEVGHNDAKSAEATKNFSANLATFATKVKAKGGKIVLVTPTARSSWSGTKADNSGLADLVAKMKAVSEAQGIEYVDLNAASIAFIEALTPAGCGPAGVHSCRGAAVNAGFANSTWNLVHPVIMEPMIHRVKIPRRRLASSRFTRT